MIETVLPDSPQYEQVIELGNANSATLGILPYSVIKEAAAEGRVLASVENGAVEGYALYRKRVRAGDIVLTHLCVDREQRGRGIARKLVESIVGRNPHRAGIYASCRQDYDAHSMWPQLGFQRWGEKPGRSRAGYLLATWWRPIAAKALFGESEQEDGRLLAAIDTNVLLDILEQRDFPASLALIADWVVDVAELAVTKQSQTELLEQRLSNERFESLMSEFRILAAADDACQAVIEQLQAEPSLAALESNVLQLVAQAATGEVEYLISRDEALGQQAEQITQITGLTLVRPDDFLLRLQTLGSDHSYQTRAIAASGMSFSTASEMPSAAMLKIFYHHHIREHPGGLRQRLAISTAHQGRIELLRADSKEPLSIAAMHRDQVGYTVKALRVVQDQQSYTVAYTAARQMVHHLRKIVANDNSEAVMVVDDQISSVVERALRDEGFRPEGSAWKAVVQTDVFGPGDVLPQELQQIGWDNLNAYLVRDYERYAWPSKVFSGTIKSYMVPIKPEYARVLLGYEEPQVRLFETHARAAVARENTYYMTPRKSVEAPARVIWWVSGGGALGGVRAMSWLDEVDTDDPHRLFSKYQDRGVLNKQQVFGSAKQFGNSGALAATALLFSQTEVFDKPVPVARAKELCPEMRTKGFFVTTRQVDEQSVSALYTEGLKSGD